MTRVPVRIVRVPFLVPAWAAAMVPFRRTLWARESATLTERLLAHELAHVKQAEVSAWPLSYVVQWARTGFRYRSMPYEAEARRAETDERYRAWARDLLELS